MSIFRAPENQHDKPLGDMEKRKIRSTLRAALAASNQVTVHLITDATLNDLLTLYSRHGAEIANNVDHSVLHAALGNNIGEHNRDEALNAVHKIIGHLTPAQLHDLAKQKSLEPRF